MLQFHKAFFSQLADPLRLIFSRKLNVEVGSLSDTDIGRRQHPRMFGKLRFWDKYDTTHDTERREEGLKLEKV